MPGNHAQCLDMSVTYIQRVTPDARCPILLPEEPNDAVGWAHDAQYSREGHGDVTMSSGGGDVWMRVKSGT